MLYNTEIAICIPKVFASTKEKRIRQLFNDREIAKISSIEMVNCEDQSCGKFKRVTIYIAFWYNTRDAIDFKEDLLAGKERKLYYDEDLYWKVSACACLPTSRIAPCLGDIAPEPVIPETNIVKNEEAASQFILDEIKTLLLMTIISNNFSAKFEDNRPYSERRLNPLYCRQDEANGFLPRKPRIHKPVPVPVPEPEPVQEPEPSDDEDEDEEGDSFFDHVRRHADNEWSQSEQFGKLDFNIDYGNLPAVFPKRNKRLVIA